MLKGILCIFILVVLFYSYIYGIESLSGLESEDVQVREKSAQSIRNDREKLINYLMILVEKHKAVKKKMKLDRTSINELMELAEKNKEIKKTMIHDGAIDVMVPWHDTKHLAILLLGDLRSTKAVPVLIQNIVYLNINFKREDYWKLKERKLHAKSPDKIYENYPALEALAKIGMPAIDPVIEKLGTYDKDCQGRKNCVWIIQKVLGVKLGRYKLQLAIEETKDEKVKKNLQAVLAEFKKLQEKLDAERARRDKEKQKQK